MSQQHALFSAKSIDEVRAERRQRLNELVAGVSNPALLNDGLAARLRNQARLELPELDRAAARVRAYEKGNGILAVATAPVSGSVELFNCRPSTFDHSPPQGSTIVLAASGGEIPRPALQMEREFERGTSPEIMKSWASKQLDHVQRYLDWMRPDVNMHNSDVEENITAGFERRRSDLGGLEALNRDLEDGGL